MESSSGTGLCTRRQISANAAVWAPRIKGEARGLLDPRWARALPQGPQGSSVPREEATQLDDPTRMRRGEGGRPRGSGMARSLRTRGLARRDRYSEERASLPERHKVEMSYIGGW